MREMLANPRRTTASLFTDLDPVLLLLAWSLMLIGYVAVTSAAVEFSANYSGRHLIYMVAAVGSGVLVFAATPKFWLDTSWIWLFLALILLILVLIPGIGVVVNGSRRWLQVGPLTLQAPEFAKLFFIIYLAGYLVRREQQVRSHWSGFSKPVLTVFAISLLLMLEPDFGATVVIVATAFGMIFLTGVRLGHFVLVGLGSVLALGLAMVAEPYRVQRLVAYIDPWADQYNSGYQLIQSLIAIGRGEWLGVGLGNSVQKLFYLSAAHTDFVFSIWAEETGLLGAALVVGLYLALVLRIFWIARRSNEAGDLFGASVCHGVAIIFATQVFINIGVSSGLLPTKGLTLPLFSFGGSSLVSCCCMLALVLRIDQQRRNGGIQMASPWSQS